jgi:hypothetical protein
VKATEHCVGARFGYHCLRNRCEKPIHRPVERRLRVVCGACNFVKHSRWISRKSGENFFGDAKISGAVHIMDLTTGQGLPFLPLSPMQR